MNRRISAPVAVVIAIAVLGVIGYFLWHKYMAGPPVVSSGPAGLSMHVTHPPRTREEGMQLYRGGH